MSRNDKGKLAPRRGFLHALDVASCVYGIRPEVIAEICGVDIATAYRWKSGRSRIPATAAAILAGELGAFGKEWRGWKIQGENIISPDGWIINRNHALSVPLQERLIKDLRERIRELEALTDEQPIPGAYPDQIKA